MHICIVGMGASGLLVANQLKEHDFISKVTVIGSEKIPTIGVGESTTLTLPAAHSKFNVDLGEFIRESHAAVKHGVYYKNWSKRDWIHFFKSEVPFKKTGLSARKYIMLLGNKDPETFIHDIYGSTVWNEAVGKNNVFPNNKGLEVENEYPHTYHFDAGHYIEYLKKQALKSPKVKLVEETVEHVKFTEGQFITNIILSDNTEIKADYYINTTGQGLNVKNIFDEQYDSLGDTLLTTKAVVYPLPYTNKREQFHPYTVAKTMKYGWRWITPTWERIGTGYTFSENHISVDEAVNEFITDIGDKTIQPNVVDFRPRVNKRTFKVNSCSIGMANGFLEPLDAPGLALTNTVTFMLEKILKHHKELFKNPIQPIIVNDRIYQTSLDNANDAIKRIYKFWTTFILNQYKTCHRLDTPFWIDQKQVNWPDWTLAIKDLNAYCDLHLNDYDVMMLAQTIAARDIQFYTPVDKHIQPIKLPETVPYTEHHLDFISKFHYDTKS
jgi:tryptophan halogenase